MATLVDWAPSDVSDQEQYELDLQTALRQSLESEQAIVNADNARVEQAIDESLKSYETELDNRRPPINNIDEDEKCYEVQDLSWFQAAPSAVQK